MKLDKEIQRKETCRPKVEVITILKLIFDRMGASERFIWLWRGTGGRLMCKWQLTFGIFRILEIA